MARKPNSALYGKNIDRRRETDEWRYIFQVGGVEYTGPCHTLDKGKAEKFAAAQKAETKVSSRKDREAGLGPMQFGTAANVWWDEEGYSNKETGLKYRLDWLIRQVGRTKLLKDITPADITAVKIERAKCTRMSGRDDKGRQLHRPITPAAVKATLVTLRTVLNYAGKHKGAAMRIFDWTTWIEKDNEEFDIRVMTEKEQKTIWHELSDDVREVAEFTLGHPKRINELLALTWPNVDLDGENIRIRIKGRRKLVDDPIAADDVQRLQRLKQRKLHPMAVFTYISERTRKYNGAEHVKGQRRPMTYQHFYERWTAACEKVGITDLNPHCLRHTGATRYYWANPDEIETVSKMLNHKSVATTIKYYAKHNPEMIREMKRRASEKQKKIVPAKVPAKLRIV